MSEAGYRRAAAVHGGGFTRTRVNNPPAATGRRSAPLGAAAEFWFLAALSYGVPLAGLLAAWLA